MESASAGPCSMSKAGRDQKFLYACPLRSTNPLMTRTHFRESARQQTSAKTAIDGPEDPRLYDGTSDAAAQRSAIRQRERPSGKQELWRRKLAWSPRPTRSETI